MPSKRTRRSTPPSQLGRSAGAEVHVARLEKALETMQLGVTITDVQGHILFMNPADARMHGYAVTELIGQHAAVLAPGQRRHPLTVDQLGAMKSWTREGLNLRKDGTAFPVRLLSDVARGPRGEPIGLVTMCEDITERKVIEEALRRSEARYQAIVERATYGIFRSSPSGAFLSVNPALVSMLGYDTADALLQADLATQVCGDPGQLAVLEDHFLHRDHPDALELEWKRQDGLPIAVRLSGQAVRAATGTFEGLEIIVEDVTERRRLEEQLRQAQKMEVVGQLTGGIAHDFNNLLTVILANADLLTSGAQQDLEQIRKDLSEVREAAQRGAAMVRQLMAFSRHERLTLEPLDLAELVERQGQVVRRLVPTNIELKVLPGRDAPMVRADASAVEQILLNLVTNARDAMPAGGALRLEIGRAWLDQEFRAAHGWGDPGEYGVLSVSDTGVGMDAVTLARVFEPFFTTKTKDQGTGLGMAMVYSLVKQHRGFVTAYSEPGEGTTIKVFFPVLGEDTGAIAPASEPSLPGGSETILIADDEAPIRRAAKRALERFGYRPLLAADGAEALDVFRAHEGDIALIVADLVMPRLGGRQLAETLRREGKAVQVLFSSGYSATDVVESLGFDPERPYLHKPWTLTDLLTRVREVLDRRPT